jgi:hypothetical protein
MVTPCCARKRAEPAPLPACERYLAPRIAEVLAVARELHAPVRILSGVYGLLAPEDLVPHYDLRLDHAGVPAHAERVTRQLARVAPATVVWIAPGAAADPHVQPYLDVLEQAAAAVGARLVRWNGPADPA